MSRKGKPCGFRRKNMVPCKMVKKLIYTHLISWFGAWLSALVSNVTVDFLKMVCLSYISKKYLKISQNPKGHLAASKHVGFAHILSCGHPGPEQCCMPSIKGMQWFFLA